MSSWALWIVYSVSVAAYPKAAAEVVGLVCDTVLLVVLLVMLRRQRVRLRPVDGWVLGGVPVLLAVWIAWGPVALAVGLAVYDAIGVAPQLLRTLRTSSLHGLSLPSWTLRSMTAAGWVVYGFGIGHPEAAGWTFVMLPAALVVCVRLVAFKLGQARRAPDGGQPPAGSAATVASYAADAAATGPVA